MYKKIFCALFVGFFVTLFFAQFDKWVHAKIADIVCEKLQSCGCNASCTIKSIYFFSPSLTVSDLEVIPTPGTGMPSDWSWKCKFLTIESSWIRFIFQGKLDVVITVEGFDGCSRIEDSSISMASFIAALMKNSVIPQLDISSILFKNGRMQVDNPAIGVKTVFGFNSSSFQTDKQLKTTCTVYDGAVWCKEQEFVKNCSAHVTLITPVGLSDQIVCKINGTVQLPHLGEDDLCYITGELRNGRGRCAVRSAHNLFIIDPIVLVEKEIRVIADIPLSYVSRCIRNTIEDNCVSGRVRARIRMNVDDYKWIDSFFTVEDVVINNHALCDSGKVVLTSRDGMWNAKINCAQKNIYSAQIAMDGIMQESCLQAMLSGRVTRGSGVVHSVSGDCISDDNEAKIHVFFDEHESLAVIGFNPYFNLKSYIYRDPEKKDALTVHATDNSREIQGTIAFSLARTVIDRLFAYDLQGEGALTMRIHTLPHQISADLSLANTTVRVPSLYNCINGFKARLSYIFDQRACVAEDICLTLHTGSLCCPRAVVHFDPSWSISSLHAPLLFDHCLLNIKKDLFAIVSGSLLCSKNHCNTTICYPRVEGHLLIDRAQLKENLLSESIQRQFFTYTQRAFSLPDVPVECDLVIETTSPIRVDTPFLQTNAQVALRLIKKYEKDISLSGTINLISGSLVFPYKPLYITKGTLTFCSDQPFDPIVELVACNKIKKYDISLQVDGSLSSHHIMLDSTPPLSEEQIVALLLIGSEENLLNAMMPALIVQNVKNMIFSSNQSNIFNSYFKPFLRPFSVNLIPSFTDKMGRGGLRGALELTVEDRWRVIIQKNFTLTEDTRFELEYLLSDDIMLRAIRDERRDIGGEVEMRWKF